MSSERGAHLPPPEVGTQIEVLVLAVRRQNAVARLPGAGNDQRLIVRPHRGLWEIAEGWLVTVDVARSWVFGSSTYAAGTVVDQRLDIGAWGLPKLDLSYQGEWTPLELKRSWQDWAPDFPPPWKNRALTPKVRACFQEIMETGSRPVYEMEQILPGVDYAILDGDPIIEAVEAIECDDWDRAYELLRGCLLQDRRCIDAHVHLGLFLFEGSSFRTREALRHYQVGVAAGDHALGPRFNGLLPWDRLDNRPFLRAVHGLGLCHWKLEDLAAASRVFRRLLWLDPEDSLGVTRLFDDLERGEPYRDRDDL